MAAARWAQGLVDAFIAGPAPRACEKAHGGTGALAVTLRVSPAAQAGESGERLSTLYSGPLAETPFGRCIAGEADRILLKEEPPEVTRSVTGLARLTLPLASAIIRP